LPPVFAPLHEAKAEARGRVLSNRISPTFPSDVGFIPSRSPAEVLSVELKLKLKLTFPIFSISSALSFFCNFLLAVFIIGWISEKFPENWKS
jgi:hypothetical protein